MIQVENLTKVFSNFRKKFTAIDGISFKVGKGEMFGFLGPNGAGKTTVVKIITGMSRPTAGRVYVCGYDILKEDVRAKEKIGLIPEAPGFYLDMRARDMLNFYAEFYNIPKEVRIKKTEKLLGIVGLTNAREKKVKTFSYGMKKRLALAAALINDPDLLILDEPMIGLDPQGTHMFRKLIRELNAKGITVFLSSHQLSEVQQLCKRVCILNRGKIEVTDKIEKLSKKIKMKINIYIDADGIKNDVIQSVKGISNVLDVEKTERGIKVVCDRDVSSDVNKILVSSGVKVHLIRKKEPSLEDIFLDLTKGGK